MVNMGACGIQERALEFLEPELYTAVIKPPGIGAGN